MANGDFLLFCIDNSKINMTFIITIKAIMTVREMTWLTCQDLKKESAFMSK